jgi:hypothetical protein
MDHLTNCEILSVFSLLCEWSDDDDASHKVKTSIEPSMPAKGPRTGPSRPKSGLDIWLVILLTMHETFGTMRIVNFLWFIASFFIRHIRLMRVTWVSTLDKNASSTYRSHVSNKSSLCRKDELHSNTNNVGHYKTYRPTSMQYNANNAGLQDNIHLKVPDLADQQLMRIASSTLTVRTYFFLSPHFLNFDEVAVTSNDRCKDQLQLQVAYTHWLG